MKRNPIIIILFALINLAACQNIQSQGVNVSDSIEHIMQIQMVGNIPYKKNQPKVKEQDVLTMADALPAFALYKDTYFTTGIPLNQTINRNTADAMFQISIRHRLTKSRLPFNSFLYMTYTQKSFWNIYADSAPFRDNNYNPSIGIGRYIIRNNTLIGTAFLQIEHESNGKSEKDSRSWNMISFSGKYFYNLQFVVGGKIWIPLVDGDENSDLIDYRGICSFTMDYITKDRRWWLSTELNPRKGSGNINTIVTGAFKISKNDNQYLYARFYNGTGDSLLDYNRYDINIRIGFCIKPVFGSLF